MIMNCVNVVRTSNVREGLLKSAESAFVGVGSNVGDRIGHCRSAIERIRQIEGCQVKRISSFYETDPIGYEDQNRFVNAVLELASVLSPLDLLDELLSIEKDMGRKRIIRWGPRIIDLDLLLFGETVMSHPRLTLPHPRMHERGFVLLPLEEIAPHAVHPVLERSVRDLLSSLPDAVKGINRL